MSDILELANAALMRAALDGFKIEVFLVELSEWNKFTDAQHDVVKDPSCVENRLMGIPVDTFPNLMQCVERSLGLAMKGRVGWILNPDPLDGLPMDGAFDCDSRV